MCYPKPGPRCYSHARKSLQKAAKTFNKNPNIETRMALADAIDDYDATPGGMKELGKKIKRNPEDTTLKKRLEEAQERRQQALDALALSKDYGDVSDMSSDKWQGVIILEEAHRAGVAAEKKALEEGHYDLVEVAPLGRSSIADRRNVTLNDEGKDISQNVYLENPKGTPLATVAKDLHNKTVKEKGSLDEGWWKASLEKWSTYAVKTNRGDAYNAAYAETLNKYGGVSAKSTATYVPETAEEVHHLISREARYKKDSHDAFTAQQGEEFGEAVQELKVLRESDRSNDEMFTEMRAVAADKIALFNKPEQAGRKRAWQEVAVILKWSQAKTRREAKTGK